MREKHCVTCMYFDTVELPQQEGQVQMGECRINPPIMIATSEILFRSLATIPPKREITSESYDDAQDSAWPIVRYWDWCGQHKEQPT